MTLKSGSGKRPTRKQFDALLSYNPRTGKFRWKKQPPKYSTITHHLHRNVIRVAGYWCHSARIAWLLTHGRWPRGDVDHINGNSRDDRIENLRDIAHSKNGVNSKLRTNNTTGITGVTRYKRTPKWWSAQIGIRGKKVHLGYFLTKTEARAAYLTAARQYVGGHVRAMDR